MTSAATQATDAETPRGPRVTVRYWAAARAAAGVAQEELTGATVAEVLAAARDRHTGQLRFAPVLAVCSLLLGDRPLGSLDLAGVDVQEGDVLEVLPPFAGG
ncbi:MAG: MoaD/ThiS family protein [Nocardioidaceae bacterium]|nr:MoaD/ThiS family protein [Nocardioidaceae bacterium]